LEKTILLNITLNRHKVSPGNHLNERVIDSVILNAEFIQL